MDPVKIMIVGCTAAGMTATPEETADLLEETLHFVRKMQKDKFDNLFNVIQEDENDRAKPSI